MMNKKIFFASLLASSLLFTSGVEAISKNQNGDFVKVTFNANGGKYSDEETSVTKEIANGTTWSSIKDSSSIPVPTCSGADFKFWSFDAKTESPIFDTYKFEDNVTLYAHWGAGTPKSFKSDSWATIVSILNNGIKNPHTEEMLYGLDALKQAYVTDESMSFGKSFIISKDASKEEIEAKTRTIELEGLGTFNVRVIGENRDFIYDGTDEPTKVAPLTFEFSEIVLPNVAYGSSSVYEGSYLQERLSEIKDLFPSALKADGGLQKVRKTVKKGGTSTEKDDYVTFNDYLFPLSQSELGKTKSDKFYEDNKYVAFENDAYPYYRYHNTEKDLIKYYNDSQFGKKVASKYITRSPSTENNDNSIFTINYDGCVDTCDCTSTTFGVAPAFAIGSPKSDNTVSVTINGLKYFTKRGEIRTGKNVDSYITFLLKDEYDPHYLQKFEIKIKGSDYPLQYGEYTFDNDTGLLTIKSDKVTDDITITVTEDFSTFKNDSWTTLIKYARNEDDNPSTKGSLDNLKNKYNNEYVANGNTFIGLKKCVKLKDNDGNITNYWARIIGENVDCIANEYATNSRSTLTFEFTRCIDDLTVDFKKGYSYSGYVQSNLLTEVSDKMRTYFIGDGSEEDAGIATRDKSLNYFNIEEDLSSEVQNVSTSSKFPVASASNYNLFKPMYRESAAYQYYSDGDVTKSYKKFVSNGVVQKNSNYWLRTFTSATEAYSYYYDVSNKGFQNGLSLLSRDSKLPFAPLFAIGKESISSKSWPFQIDIPTYDLYSRHSISNTALILDLREKKVSIPGSDEFIVSKIPPTKEEFLDTFLIIINGIEITKEMLSNGIINMNNYQISEDQTTKMKTLFVTISFNAWYSSYCTGPGSISLRKNKLDCTWDNVVKIAKYDEEHDKNGEFAKSYLPLGQYITFKEGEADEFNARIIGFGHDPLVETSGHAAVTFEFDDVIGGKDHYSDYLSLYDDKNTYDFSASKLNSFLNDEETGYINKMPAEVLREIKSVRKNYSTSIYSDNEYSGSYYNTKLFPLSFNEINGKLCGLNDQYKNYILDTSTTYDLYKLYDSNSKYNKDCRLASCNYYLRSCVTDSIMRSISPDKSALFVINDSSYLEGKNNGLIYFNGNTDSLYPICPFSTKLGVRPAFCI